MCYYNGQKVTRSEFIRLKNLEKEVRRYNFLNVGVHNGFMFEPAAIAIANSDKTDFELVQAQWGFMPYGIDSHEKAQEFLRRYTTMNFKSENMLLNEKKERSMWASSVEKGKTCLVLSTGMIENRHINKIGKKGQQLTTTDAFPYMVTMKDREYWWMAGLYNQVLDKETGELVYTFAFATTKANALMRQIHNKDNKWRMPAILNDDQAYEWLLGGPSVERMQELARIQVSSKDMEYCTITKEYLSDRVANPTQYDALPPIDMAYMDTAEELLYPAA
ncbi:SOS response-associated peptidase [Mucilaginibacter rubeus]|uniref:Abasic site processing protein n=2 Tax=Mucilaginibacter rubeus TaxID=2027860 RepID=A0A5C1I378_9SPHI|nr:SOS response-associated peptidase [Mucilaginibacter rubeus]